MKLDIFTADSASPLALFLFVILSPNCGVQERYRLRRWLLSMGLVVGTLLKPGLSEFKILLFS
jgi:hypothetical protein